MVALRTGVESGIPGVELQEGEHICALYRGDAERDRLLRGYLSAGILAGDRCVCVVDSVQPAHVTALVAGTGPPGAGAGELAVHASRDTYLRPGHFDPEVMLGFWEATARASAGRRAAFTRAVGEMTWALKDFPGVERLIEYESRLNRFLPRYPQVILCLYDLERFGGELVMSLMRTHPRMLINGTLLENSYYMEPEELLGQLDTPSPPGRGLPPAPAGTSPADARGRLSQLQGLLIIGMLMTVARREAEVVRLTLSTVPTLVACDLVALVLAGPGGGEVHGTVDGGPIPGELTGPICAWAGRRAAPSGTLGGLFGDFAWTSVHPLRSLDAAVGALVVASRAACPRPEEAALLLQSLAMQTAANLANARLHDEERRRGDELRSLSDRLEAALGRSGRILEIHEQLNRTAGDGTGVAGIAGTLHHLVGLPLVVEDERANRLAVAGGQADPRSMRQPELANIRRRLNWASLPLTVGDWVVQPVRSRGELLASIWVSSPQRAGPDDLTLVALEYAATVLALELSHERRLAETELRLRRDFTEELLEGMLGEDAGAPARAKALGVDLALPSRVAVARSPRGASLSLLLETVRGSMIRLATLKDGQLAFVVPDGADWDQLRGALERGTGDPRLAIGVGSACRRLGDYPRSYLEARRAVHLISESRGGLLRFDDLGVLKVLLASDQPLFLEEFSREWLRALIEYDEAHHADLVRTLAAYLDCGGNQLACAAALFIHVSTLKYRLQRIRDISGLDLSDPNVRFHLQLATKAREALQVLRAAGSGEREGA